MVKFLVVRFSSIGDIVLTTPVVRHLKKQVENAEVHFLTKESYTSLLDANPYVDKVHSFDGNMKSCLHTLKKEGYDYIIDLHHNTRTARIKLGLKRMDFSVKKLNALKWLYVNFNINRLPAIHMVDRNLETIRMFIDEQDDGGLDYFIPEDGKVELPELHPGFADGYLALAIGAQHETKKLPPESLIALCKKLSVPVMILGGPGDRETGESVVKALPGKQIVNGCGAFSIHQSAFLMEQSRVLITHDTGLMHIGAALGKKIITIWGNTVPEFGMYPYRADPSSVNFEVPNLKCRPCSKIGHQRCPKKHFRCMLDQDLDGIAVSAESLFSKKA
ncbi:MAG: glycosyltransferase family 9 protein [Bacteroidetes bacterium]|nr:glycosyltransferase family 9 protein [Bacteroidota bacterium]